MNINKTALAVLLVLGLLALSVSGILLGTINPGFEGAKCWFDGVYVHQGMWEGYTGSNQYHAYADAEDWLAQQYDPRLLGDKWKTLEWTNFAQPNDAGIGHDFYEKSALGSEQHTRMPDIKIQVESNIQLSAITRQGNPDPLAWNIDDPLTGRRIEYWSKKGTKVTETENTILYEYELTKESFLITPAEFWVGFYLIPSQTDAQTGSGWREGEYSDITAWFMLDFHTWDNAYYDDWMDDPEDEVYTTEFGGTVISQAKKLDPDAYRGGFPITGWIQGWEKAGWTSAGSDEQSPVWYDVRQSSGGSNTLTQEQLWDLRDILMSKVEFSPGMVGSFINLYDAPDKSFTYVNPQYTEFGNNDAMTQQVRAPDSRMKKTMYFPISMENFGTYAQDTGWWGLSGWKVYYPSAYFRIRMIYGVYGSFKYLWTEEVTKPFVTIDPETGEPEYTGGLDYPEEFERHGTTVIHTRGPLSPFQDVAGGLFNWFTDPFGILTTLFIILVIIIILVTVLNPGVWTSIVQAYSKTKKGRKGFKSH